MAELRYTSEHEWIRMDGDIATIHGKPIGRGLQADIPDAGRHLDRDPLARKPVAERKGDAAADDGVAANGVRLNPDIRRITQRRPVEHSENCPRRAAQAQFDGDFLLAPVKAGNIHGALLDSDVAQVSFGDRKPQRSFVEDRGSADIRHRRQR